MSAVKGRMLTVRWGVLRVATKMQALLGGRWTMLAGMSEVERAMSGVMQGSGYSD